MTSSPSPSSPSFDARAARYDELRPVDERWWESFDAIVRLGDLRGMRVLEVGCGTGRLAHALDERALARVWAVDASPEMVAHAKALGVNARVARAEALPFKPGWFDRGVMRMSAHLVDRPRAFAELARVLAPGGRLIVASADPARFDDGWLPRFFPSAAEADRSRFPTEDALREELTGAGFAAVEFERFAQTRTLTRERALEIVRARIYSTFDLLPPGEYEEGLARAESGLSDVFEHSFHWLIGVARC